MEFTIVQDDFKPVFKCILTISYIEFVSIGIHPDKLSLEEEYMNFDKVSDKLLALGVIAGKVEKANKLNRRFKNGKGENKG